MLWRSCCITLVCANAHTARSAPVGGTLGVHQSGIRTGLQGYGNGHG